MADANKNCCWLQWNSYKSFRITRSALVSEVYGLCDAVDIGISLSIALKQIKMRKLPVPMLTDSKKLLDTNKKSSHTSEKRLLIDLAAVRKA